MAGGRGGRGGGRGGFGSKPKSASQQYLHTSAQAAGIDVRHIRGASSVGGIFPDFEWHSSGARRLRARETENRKSGDRGGAGEGRRDGDAPAVKEEPDAGGSNASPTTPSDGDRTASEKPRSARDIYLVSKSREIHMRFQSSVFYVRSTKEVPDVVRYGDRLRPPPNTDASAVLSHCLGGKKRTRGEGGGVFVPEELCGGQCIGGGPGVAEEERRSSTKKGLNLTALARKIRAEGGGVTDNAEPGGGSADEDGGGEFTIEQEGEESDGADYAQNYYESEGEVSAGSDGEPTF